MPAQSAVFPGPASLRRTGSSAQLFPQKTIFLVYLARAPARKGFRVILATHGFI